MGNDESKSYVTATDDAGCTLLRFEVDDDGEIDLWDQAEEELTGTPMPELNIYFPASVRNFGAFFEWYELNEWVMIQNLYVAKENPVFASHDGALYSKDMTRLIFFPDRKSGPAVIPEGVTAIEPFMVSPRSNPKLESITLPASLTCLDGNPLSFCKNLTEINVSEENPVYCSKDGILCSKDMSGLVCFPCGRKGAVEIPEGVTSISGDAFAGCSGIQSLHLPASMGYIAKERFEFLQNLESISVAEDSECFSSEDGVLYDKAKENLILCPEGKAGRLSVPESVQSIDLIDLMACKKLEVIDIQGTETIIEINKMKLINANPGALEEIHVPAGHIKYESVDGVLYDKDLSQLLFLPPHKGGIVTVPEGISEISAQAIFLHSRIEILNIPASLVRLNERLLEWCGRLREINITEGNCLYASKDGIVYSKDMSTLIFCPRGKAGELVVIPDGVTRIAYGNIGLIWFKRLVIPASVTSIDKGTLGKGNFPIHVREGNPVYELAGGMLRRKAGGKL